MGERNFKGSEPITESISLGREIACRILDQEKKDQNRVIQEIIRYVFEHRYEQLDRHEVDVKMYRDLIGELYEMMNGSARPLDPTEKKIGD